MASAITKTAGAAINHIEGQATTKKVIELLQNVSWDTRVSTLMAYVPRINDLTKANSKRLSDELLYRDQWRFSHLIGPQIQ